MPLTAHPLRLFLALLRVPRPNAQVEAKGGTGSGGSDDELEACAALASGLAARAAQGEAAAEAWAGEWRSVYGLAEAVMQRVEREGP